MYDRDIFGLIEQEREREIEHVELIASENFVSKEVRTAVGSVLTNKYAEGYPGKRFYGGCEIVDKIESLAIDRVKELFKAKYANVQPHSGSQANMAAILSLIKPGSKILGMELAHGGHLTHGSKVNFSGMLFDSYSYGVDRDTELIDYDNVLKLAKKIRPNLIIAGATAYSREIDFEKFRTIADEVGAYLLCDIAHIAGLIVTGFHNSPIDCAHVTTSTVHKTLRGPRGGLILLGKENNMLIDYNNKARSLELAIASSVFPSTQGGPLMHVIAGKAIAFKEALSSVYKEYVAQILKNAKIMASYFNEEGFRVVSGGTDNHLFLVDLSNIGMTGNEVEKKLSKINITLNKNMIPFDTQIPSLSSGVRIGTAAITTRGLKEQDSLNVAKFIIRALKTENESELIRIRGEVVSLMRSFPFP